MRMHFRRSWCRLAAAAAVAVACIERPTIAAAQPPATGAPSAQPPATGAPVDLPDVPVPVDRPPTAPADPDAPPAPPQPNPTPPPGPPNDGLPGDASGISGPAMQSAGDSSTISGQRLDIDVSPTLEGVFRYEPGIQIQSAPGRTGIGSINIRGLEGNRVLIQVDGIRTPDGFQQGPVQIGRDTVDTSLLKQVDITRGAGSLIYGEGAIGGVVNFETKDPRDFLGTFGNDQYAAFRFGHYTADRSFQETGTIAARSGDWEGSFSYTRRNGHDLEAAGNFPTDPQRYDTDYILSKLAYNIDRNSWLTYTFEWYYDDLDTTINSSLGNTTIAAPGAPNFPLPGFGLATRIGSVAQDDTRRTRHSLRFQSVDDTRDWGQNVRAEIYYQDYRVNDTRLQTFRGRTGPFPIFAPPGAIILAPEDNQFSQNFFGGRVIVRDEYESEAAEHDVVYGFDALRNDTVRLRQGSMINTGTGAVQNTNFIGEPTPSKIIPDITTIRVGAFWRDQVMVNDGQWWFTPGIRVNYYNQDPKPDALFDPTLGVLPQSISEWAAQPYFEVGVPVTERLTSMTRYTRGYRAPPVEDAALGFRNAGFGYVILPNPNLMSETSDGVETGLTYNGDYVVGYVNGYYTHYDNFIENVALGVIPETAPLLAFQQRNLEAQIFGTEFALEVRLSGVIESDGNFAGWSTYGNLTHVVGDNLTNNVPLDSIPAMFGMVGLRYRAEDGAWGVEANTNLVHQKNRPSGTVANQFIPPGYATLDLLAYAQVTRNARVNMGLFNVFDTEYTPWLNVRGIAANNAQRARYTQPGINFGGTVSLEY